YLLLERAWRPERQHDVLGRPPHAHPDRRRRLTAGREVADQEPREGDEGAAISTLRDGASQAAGSDRQGPPQPGGHRRAIRKDPHVQLPAEPHHGSPDQLHHAPHQRGAQRRDRRAARPAVDVLPVGEAEGRHRGIVKTIREYVATASDRLSDAGIDAAANLDARLLAQHVLGWDAARLLMSAGDVPPDTFPAAFDALVSRRAAREPLAYITGHKEFWNLQFEVTPDVLIPRPETELIVEAALSAVPPSQLFTMIDVCTGCGNVAVAVAHERSGARIVATDISEAALEVARRNGARYATEGR